jgi:HEAT repeat protein
MTPAEQLSAALRDRDSRRGLEAVRKLLGSGSEEFLPVLTAALADSDGLVRRRAVQALGLLPAAAAVEPLSAALARDASWPVREAAAQALAGFITDNRAGTALLLASLRERHPLARAAAVAALARVGEPGRSAVLDELRLALGSPRAVRRRRAVAALARLREPATVTVPLLAQALSDPHAKVRRDAAGALADFGAAARPALGPLVRRSYDRDPAVRAAAATSLDALRPSLPARESDLLAAAAAGRSAEAGLTAALGLNLPGRVWAEFAAACRRRRRWYCRTHGRPEPEDDPPGDVLADLLAEADQAGEREQEAVWLLGQLAELLADDAKP